MGMYTVCALYKMYVLYSPESRWDDARALYGCIDSEKECDRLA